MQKLMQQHADPKSGVSKGLRSDNFGKPKPIKSKFGAIPKSPSTVPSSDEPNLSNLRPVEASTSTPTQSETLNLGRIKRIGHAVKEDHMRIKNFADIKTAPKTNPGSILRGVFGISKHEVAKTDSLVKGSANTTESENLSETKETISAPEMKEPASVPEIREPIAVPVINEPKDIPDINEPITIPSIKDLLSPGIKGPASNPVAKEQIDLRQIRKQNRRSLLKGLPLPPIAKDPDNEVKETPKSPKDRMRQLQMLKKHNRSARNLNDGLHNRMDKFRHALEMTAHTKIQTSKEEGDIPQRSIKRLLKKEQKNEELGLSAVKREQPRVSREKNAEALKCFLSKTKPAVASLSPSKEESTSQVSKGEVEVLETLRSLSRTTYVVGASYDPSSKRWRNRSRSQAEEDTARHQGSAVGTCLRQSR